MEPLLLSYCTTSEPTWKSRSKGEGLEVDRPMGEAEEG